MKKAILFILLFLILSCEKNKIILQEDYINLYPNKELIEKHYYKYSIYHPSYPKDTLFTPIEPSKTNSDRAKILIKGSKSYDLQHFNEYLINQMGGNYSDYIIENNLVLYRYYFKYYKKNEFRELDNKQKIEKFLNKQKIEYNFIKFNKEKAFVYLFKKKGQVNPAFCVIDSREKSLEIMITYDVNDTIKSPQRLALRPFIGSEIEY